MRGSTLRTWDAAVADLVLDLGEVSNDLGRAERLVRKADTLEPARRAEREAAQAVSLVVNRHEVPQSEIDATVGDARQAIARARTLVADITSLVERSRMLAERVADLSDRALELREQAFKARNGGLASD